MSTEKIKVGTIDLTPSWETAARIYIACLENPNASPRAKQGARKDLIRMAQNMDMRMKAKSTEEKL